ncbi:hypothetical protein [Chryseobacterium fistulae]|uniref:Uncharacterized protein n=1 Tax=Chryseobacterium fistulae TaxID=2675058 RepID=A0A6N4XWF0_9FLAO|nr:hypothetical protein [Chryseobacterium fistulae]CAA7392827.1 hypothetical protein CHRY9393_03414 [Chryseobacterium fistulae]
MIKKILFKQLCGDQFLGLMIISSTLLSIIYMVQAQTCSNVAYILPNGMAILNGIQVTSSSSGIYFIPEQSYNGGCTAATINSHMLGGYSETGWSMTLSFDKPVNDVVFLYAGAGSQGSLAKETIVFNSNKGVVSIVANASCFTEINGNTIISYSAGTSTLGGGNFKISAPNDYTQLVIKGSGEWEGS